jgi:hypothetical protein
MAKGKKTLAEKVQKEMPEFAGTVDGLSVDELEKRISTYAKEGESVETAKENDEGLQAAKEQVKEFNAPYSDAKKAIRMKIKYLIQLVGEKGGSV